MKHHHLLLSLLLLAVPAQARIGETLAQLTTRYGDGRKASSTSSTTTTGDSYTFRKGNVRIHALLLNGVCERLSFQLANSNRSLKPQEINVLLKANANGSTWTELDPPKYFFTSLRKPKQAWFRGDRKAAAANNHSQLTIYSLAWAAAYSKAAAAKEAEAKARTETNLQGF